MPLESATFIGDLNVANPVSTDVVAQGDDHFRLVKAALKTTLPNADKAFYLPDSVNKASAYTVLSTDINKIITVDGTAGAFNLTLPSLGASDDGWGIWVIKTDASANAVTIVGTINGAANLSMSAQYQANRFFWTGTAWLSAGVPTLPLPVASLNIASGTALADPALLDELPIYDDSATANKVITPADLLKILNLLTAEASIAADDLFLMYDTSASNVRKVTAANLGATITLPTRQILLSGTGATYTTPAGARQLRVRMMGGGGGGAARTTNDGAAGGTTTFAGVTANGGNGGTVQGSGGAGGTAGSGSASLRLSGAAGMRIGNNHPSGDTQMQMAGAPGGSSPFGGAGAPTATTGGNAVANTGSGGASATSGATSSPNGSGAAGEYVELVINTPAASYNYTVGAAGAGGVAGSVAGGDGGSGIIIVDEYY